MGSPACSERRVATCSMPDRMCPPDEPGRTVSSDMPMSHEVSRVKLRLPSQNRHCGGALSSSLATKRTRASLACHDRPCAPFAPPSSQGASRTKRSSSARTRGALLGAAIRPRWRIKATRPRRSVSARARATRLPPPVSSSRPARARSRATSTAGSAEYALRIARSVRQPGGGRNVSRSGRVERWFMWVGGRSAACARWASGNGAVWLAGVSAGPIRRGAAC